MSPGDIEGRSGSDDAVRQREVDVDVVARQPDIEDRPDVARGPDARFDNHRVEQFEKVYLAIVEPRCRVERCQRNGRG